MTRARLLLAVAALAFVGWLGWLAYAVAERGRAVVLSRAQLTAASHLLVAEVTVGEDGLPEPKVRVVEVLRGGGVKPQESVEVLNLPAAMPPGANGFPGPGTYLLPVVVVGDGETFRVADLPRSPGYEAQRLERPPIYPWTDDTRAQLKGLGLIP